MDSRVLIVSLFGVICWRETGDLGGGGVGNTWPYLYILKTKELSE